MAEACRQKWYCERKIGAVILKPGDLVLVKADAFKGKRKIKDRWEEETWELVHQITTDVPYYESEKPTQKVMSPPPKLTSHLHQRLAFPCVWAVIIHGTGVQSSPHARLPQQEVKGRGCHKRTSGKAVTQ